MNIRTDGLSDATQDLELITYEDGDTEVMADGEVILYFTNPQRLGVFIHAMQVHHGKVWSMVSPSAVSL